MEFAHQLTQKALDEISVQLTEDELQYVMNQIQDLMRPKHDKVLQLKIDVESLGMKLAKVKDDYISGAIAASDFTQLKAQLTELLFEREAELEENETELTALNQKDRTALSRVLNIGEIYYKSTNYDKLKILKSVFPNGFSILKGPKHLRTTYRIK